jgi:hypothetical protein
MESARELVVYLVEEKRMVPGFYPAGQPARQFRDAYEEDMKLEPYLRVPF